MMIPLPDPDADAGSPALPVDGFRTPPASAGPAGGRAAQRPVAVLSAEQGHAMRTALQAIIGYAHLLVHDPAIPDASRAATRVAKIGDAARELLALVQELQRVEPAAPTPQPLHVVYVEDNPVTAEMVVALLETRARLRVEIVGDRQGAAAALQRLQPSLLIADLELLAADGFATWRRLRREPDGAGVPCIGLTVRPDAEALLGARAEGIDELLAIPVDADALLALVDRLLPGLAADR